MSRCRLCLLVSYDSVKSMNRGAATSVRATLDLNPKHNTLDWPAKLDGAHPNWEDPYELTKFGNVANRDW